MRTEVRRFNDFGGADHGWLNTRHHFSFADYHDPARMGFGVLRVVNDDTVAAGTGFDPHPHRDMEIITYVRKGEVGHRDSLGNEGKTPAGSVQVMSAGTGITHAEYASETEETTLFQIWIFPRAKGVAPRWDMAQFPQEPAKGALPLLVSGDEAEVAKGALMIHADARLWGGKLAAGTVIAQDFGLRVYLVVSTGEVKVGPDTLHAGDALAVEEAGVLELAAASDAEVVVIGMPK
ncbi:MAG: hypothetical protein GC129_06285 [Proteobacteria bacterium]|nr:hypothetical protein [Pseudomonadota bacterium]